MPKVSSASKDAVEVSLGIQEGVIEVTKAVVKVHQFPPNKNTGVQGDPFACIQLTVVRCNADGDRISDDEITEELGIGKLEKFHPGKAASATDQDPEDLGTEVDTEGNCIYAADTSAHLNKKCKWILFSTSLEDKGFKPEVLGNGYMPDLVGLKAEVFSEVQPRMPGSTSAKDPTALKVKRILQFPYEKKAAKAAAKAAKTPAPAAAPTPVAAENDGDSPEALALKFLAEVAAEKTGKDGVERKVLATGVQTKLMRARVPVKQHKPVIDLVKDDGWIAAQTSEVEDSPIYGKFMVDIDAGTVAFS